MVKRTSRYILQKKNMFPSGSDTADLFFDSVDSFSSREVNTTNSVHDDLEDVFWKNPLLNKSVDERRHVFFQKMGFVDDDDSVDLIGGGVEMERIRESSQTSSSSSSSSSDDDDDDDDSGSEIVFTSTDSYGREENGKATTNSLVNESEMMMMIKPSTAAAEQTASNVDLGTTGAEKFNSNRNKMLNWWTNKIGTKTKVMNAIHKRKDRRREAKQTPSTTTKVQVNKKRVKDLTAVYLGQQFQAHKGAIDDGDSPIPPKHVLSWNSKKEKSTTSQGAKRPSSVQKSSHSSSNRGSTRGFSRLKVNKVRDLIEKGSGGRQEITHDKYEMPDGEGEDSDESDYLSSSSEDDSFTITPAKKRESVHREIDQLQQNRQYTSKKWVRSGDVSVGNIRGKSSVQRRGWGSSEPGDDSPDDPSSRDFKGRGKRFRSSEFFSKKLFKDLGCSADMIESLRAQHFERPSHIQSMTFEPVLEGKTCIIADQSGSGKTLAYLAPIVQRLREEELQGISKSSSRSPRAVILVPTAELASQVLRSCRSMSKSGMPFRSVVVTGGFRQKTQLESLEQDLDVLIATPGRFMYLINEGYLRLTNIRCAVVDEVDILFADEEFEVALQRLMTSSPVTTQYLFVTATLPLDIYNKLVEVFPDCEVVMGPGIHRTSSGLEEVLVDCSGVDGAEKTPETAFSNKKGALLRLVEGESVAKTIVFCNKIETCRKVENALKRSDRKGNRIVLPFHAAMAQETRLANMKQFLESQPSKDELILVCTDRASRGIDFAGVDHVILFDFPRDPSEYIRRVGRTARGARGTGKAFTFVVGKQVSLARRIMERNQKGHPLHEVPSSYEMMR